METESETGSRNEPNIPPKIVQTTARAIISGLHNFQNMFSAAKSYVVQHEFVFDWIRISIAHLFGIEKSKEAFNNADLIIFMADRSRVLDEEDFSILSHIGEKKAIVILNKTDLPKAFDETEIEKLLPKAYIIEASVANGEGIEELENVVENLVYGGEVKQSDSMMVTNVRHKNLLEEADSSLADAIEMAKACQPLELLEIDASRAYECLGAIIGEAVEEDIINEVFARFCLGK